jgi:hypothetical protein
MASFIAYAKNSDLNVMPSRQKIDKKGKRKC